MCENIRCDDGLRQLALAVCSQAIIDVNDKDPKVRIDALTWLILDCPGWLDELGIDFDECTLRRWVLGGCYRGKYRRSRRGATPPAILGVKSGTMAVEREMILA